MEEAKPDGDSLSEQDPAPKVLQAARIFLCRNDYRILEECWECDVGVIDLIAWDEDTLVFVDVQAYPTSADGFPAEEKTDITRKNFEDIAIAYLKNIQFFDCKLRFDVIAAYILDSSHALLKHHLNAFAFDR